MAPLQIDHPTSSHSLLNDTIKRRKQAMGRENKYIPAASPLHLNQPLSVLDLESLANVA